MPGNKAKSREPRPRAAPSAARAVPEPDRIEAAWRGRVSGCLLGKAVEVLSFEQGREGIESYLQKAGAWPLRDYVPLLPGTTIERTASAWCRGRFSRAEPDDDINYTLLALLVLEQKGIDFDTADIARSWIRLLPAGATWTAERAAYLALLEHMADEFVNGAEPGFDLRRCADNPFNDWIGAQIRADLYGWVCPGNPALAADLARRDAALSHTGDAVDAARFIAALGAAIPTGGTLEQAIETALACIPPDSGTAAAVSVGRDLAGEEDAVSRLHDHYAGLPPIHSLNNLALVVWALCAAPQDFSLAIGEVVSAGWDTDCNGATVGGLLGLAGIDIPAHWTDPWQGRVGVSLAGHSEYRIDELAERTVAVGERILSSAING